MIPQFHVAVSKNFAVISLNYHIQRTILHNHTSPIFFIIFLFFIIQQQMWNVNKDSAFLSIIKKFPSCVRTVVQMQNFSRLSKMSLKVHFIFSVEVTPYNEKFLPVRRGGVSFRTGRKCVSIRNFLWLATPSKTKSIRIPAQTDFSFDVHPP